MIKENYLFVFIILDPFVNPNTNKLDSVKIIFLYFILSFN